MSYKLRSNRGWSVDSQLRSYVLRAYIGRLRWTIDGRTLWMRTFTWEDGRGRYGKIEGNARAFYQHLCVKYKLTERETAWVALHDILRARGQRVWRQDGRSYSSRRYRGPQVWQNSPPRTRPAGRP